MILISCTFCVAFVEYENAEKTEVIILMSQYSFSSCEQAVLNPDWRKHLSK